ncbi:unnamed protein product [Eruca vesicaria subsp. sativa]|uniref:Transcription factor CBF/NF-Y/archaeal histone domain-containing protein n=1 Tax=Eruca vesicaria subsp. sativa TaxID=29727 RepID=A0ABC8KIL3_ERUVS|nr:unnamed protein product [Eruca vesicaria subsp. sativa]
MNQYISFVTSEANQICQSAQRTTITADDILSAMRNLGLDDYVEPLGVFINRYRLSETDREYTVRGESSQGPPPPGPYGWISLWLWVVVNW